ELSTVITSRPHARRKAIPGLNADRADSIIGGVLVAEATMEVLGAGDMTVTEQGLREGLVYDTVRTPPPPTEEVRRMSVAALARRFTSWDPGRADRRERIAALLKQTMDPGADPEHEEILAHAAAILDIGRSIDYYRRYEHTADILTESDLAGFSHRDLALLAAVV